MPTPILGNSSPHYMLHCFSPSYSFLRVFGCLCFSLIRHYNRNKLEFRSAPCVFLGYPNSFLGYRCMDLNTNKTFVCRHVRFDESIYLFASSKPEQGSAAPKYNVPWSIVQMKAPTLPELFPLCIVVPAADVAPTVHD